MEKVKNFLRKSPLLYFFVQKIYGSFRLAREYIFGIKIDEKEEKRWELRHVNEGENWAVEGYWEVRNHPATHLLLEKLDGLSPFSSVLEVGCNCGPNLFSIAKKFPAAKIKGVDINSNAISEGRKLLAKENIKNVELLVGKAYDLRQFSDKSFDIVFSKAVLTHIGPSRVHKVAEEMFRLAKQKIVLIEQWADESQDINGDGKRENYAHRWDRNYRALFEGVAGAKKIVVENIPDNVWKGGNWAIIEVTV